MTLDQWLSDIQVLHHQRIDFGLERILPIAQQLSLTTFSVPVITVAGTNGKGSTVKTLESIYTAADYRTALYTSPHILKFNERIRVNNQEIDDQSLITAFSVIHQARKDISLSFFEFTTLAALYLFQQAKPEVIILEVGLGGRLDAVNIVENDLAIVTSIDLDHEVYLGNTRESIAYEKASIARRNKHFLCGDPVPPHTLYETVVQRGSILKNFSYRLSGSSGKNFIFEMEEVAWSLPLSALKLENIACAVAGVKVLLPELPVSHDAIARGITLTDWPGRFEHFYEPFHGILDVAHNPAATAWLSKQCAALPPVAKTIGIVGMLKDKAITHTIQPMLACVDIWYVCSLLSEDA